MSKATKRKHVTREVLDDFVIPEDEQIIVKIIGSRGNNLHEAETPSGDHFLISMPPKFRKNVWIKRGNYVIVDPIKEGSKVCAEIAHILYPQQVKHLKKEGIWPEQFMKNSLEHNVDHDLMAGHITREKNQGIDHACSDSESESDGDSELFVNTNHFQSLVIYTDSSSSDDSDDNSDDESEEDIPDVETSLNDNNNMNKIE